MSGDWTVEAIVRATLPVLLVLTLIEIGSGMVLHGFEDTLVQYPTLLVLVPVVIGTAGNLGSMLASRLSTALHLGTLTFGTNALLVGHVLGTILLAGTLFPAVGAGAWLLTSVIGSPTLGLGRVLIIATLSGVVLALVVVIVTVSATYAAYRRRADPDDVVIPTVTNVCDVLGVLVLFAVAQLVV